MHLRTFVVVATLMGCISGAINFVDAGKSLSSVRQFLLVQDPFFPPRSPFFPPQSPLFVPQLPFSPLPRLLPQQRRNPQEQSRPLINLQQLITLILASSLRNAVNSQQDDGNWSDWSSWSACDKTDCGIRRRTRTCEGGNDCVGNSEEIEACDCSSPGTWGNWGVYGPCSRGTCGFRTRTRTCSGGSGCVGDSTETTPCNCPFPDIDLAEWTLASNGRWYRQIETDFASYQDAQDGCDMAGGRLITEGMRSIAVRNELSELLNAGTNYWIGLTDIDDEGNFVWDDGVSGTGAHWSNNEPNNSGGNENCAVVSDTSTMRINDVDCDWTAVVYAICESRDA